MVIWDGRRSEEELWLSEHENPLGPSSPKPQDHAVD